ncbi:Polysaccharide pyruvyl transferase [Prevotella sp. khp1]|uniref:polysaccharide pyruvyl transferase family protein n=1 Tax=Prevotellaceae TaxID=171552 RepID=UPI00088DCACF|nr:MULTISPECIES: polysaccharide pyruvyl transferase family protein [Prevotellaceae]QVJ80397.1 polysaccharide pyruvyl transferase family protein [Xylanibacter ruminicola]SDQ22673.1 Polysaccharide pyruvyl transferase [Prevotella sp. khp1]
MKIGVLTFWHGNANYGMMLQCWALQQVLKSMGHEPFVIRFSIDKKKGLPRRFLETLGLYGVLLRFINPYEYKQQKKKYLHDKLRMFESFRQKNLDLSPCTYKTLKAIKSNPPVADCYIVGSDQVWSQILSCEDNKAYFLEFGDISTKRISYAPSFGFANYPIDYLSELRNSLKNLDTISCREQAGVDICKSVGIDATKVLDPTLLLDKGAYIKLANKTKALTYNPYIFIYSLNISNSEDICFHDLNEYRHHANLGLVVTPGDGYVVGDKLFGDDAIYSYSTIEQWLTNILNASLVVTPSFHGVVLSIILQRPFVYAPLRGVHSGSNNRVTELLQDLGLESRILTGDRIYTSIANESIDWNYVEHRLNGQKHISLNFLSSSLKYN